MPRNKFLNTKENKAGDYRMVFSGLNNETVFTSESYSTKSNAQRAMRDFERMAVEFLESKGYTVSKGEEAKPEISE